MGHEAVRHLCSFLNPLLLCTGPSLVKLGPSWARGTSSEPEITSCLHPDPAEPG